MTGKIARKITLKQLLVVQALGEHKNTHRAAGHLNMTQSTVSKHLKELEHTFGTSLFSRHARGMTPTNLGQYTIHFADTIVSRVERFADELEHRVERGHGMLVIGAIMGAAPDLVAYAVTELKKDRPGLTVRLLGETSDQILDMLEDGRLDLAVGRFSTPRHWQLFDFEPLGEEPLKLVVKSGHLLLKQPSLTLRELHDWPWILQPHTTPSRQLLDDAFGRISLGSPENHVESSSIFAALQLLQNSDAIALLPSSVVNDHLKSRLLASLPDLIDKKIRGFGIVRRRGEELSDTADEFANILRSSVPR